MIFFSADDIGLSYHQLDTVLECYKYGVLNSVSVFQNGKYSVEIVEELKNYPEITLSLHLNIIEGKCCSSPSGIPLLVDKNGVFKLSFIKLLLLSLTQQRRKLKDQISKELISQIKFFSELLPEGSEIRLDGHRHVQMIPLVFSLLISFKTTGEFNIGYIRIPDEPLLPFFMEPSLFLTYNFLNIVKNRVLHILWSLNKRKLKGKSISTGIFFGVIASGRMNFKTVKKLFPYFYKLMKKDNENLEIVFHPCCIDSESNSSDFDNIKFSKFYKSKKRSIEKTTMIDLLDFIKQFYQDIQDSENTEKKSE